MSLGGPGAASDAHDESSKMVSTGPHSFVLQQGADTQHAVIDQLESIDSYRERRPANPPMPRINFTMKGQVPYAGAAKARSGPHELPPIQSGQQTGQPGYGPKSYG